MALAVALEAVLVEELEAAGCCCCCPCCIYHCCLTNIFSNNMKYRGSDIYPPVSPYDMMNQIGASPPPADTNGGTTGGLAMGASDPVVAGYNKSSGVVNLLHARPLLHVLKRPNRSHRAFISHSSFITCIINVALLMICFLYMNK